MIKVLVTGATGFIGRYVCQKLTQNGYKVIRVVRPRSRFEESEGQEALHIDLCEPGSLECAIKDKPDTVVHLAAVVPLSFAGAEATKAAHVNRRIDKNVFLACRALGTGVVYASGTSVYGLGNSEVKSESSSVRPIGPYAAGKLAGEQMGERILFQLGLPFTVLRINAPYGPGQRAKTVLNLFIERAINGLPLFYHGTGSRQQDFTYIEDVADAVIKAVIQGRSGIYNISGGHPISMRQLAEIVVRCVPECTSCVGPSGEEDPQEGATAMYSIKQAMTDLGWQPQVSLESGIRAWVWTRLEESHENWASV